MHHPGEFGGQMPPQAFGTILRDTRLSLGRTIEDVERQTRILARHLHALEAGEFDRLPPGIYARGFVHNYAAYLRLNPQEMVRLFVEARGEVETFYRPQPVARPVNMGGPISPNFVVIVFVVGMLAVVTAWGYTLLVQPAPPRLTVIEATQANATPTGIANFTVVPPRTAGGVTIGGVSSTTEASGAVAAPPTPTVPPVTEFKVILKATERAYYKVSVDDQFKREGFLEKGGTLDLPPGKTVKIFSGAPGSITYSVNGDERGALPKEAYTNKPDGYEITAKSLATTTAVNPNASVATPTVVRKN